MPNQYSRENPMKVTYRKVRSPILPIGPSIGYIELPQERYVLMDYEDALYFSQWNWGVSGKYPYYPSRQCEGKSVRLHRLVCYSEELVDHINRNRYDARRANLRPCTFIQNMQNMSHEARNTSGFRGITRRKDSQYWVAIIRCNKEVHRLGSFLLAEDAARAYDKAAKELHGDFARLNFTDEVTA